MSRNERVEIEQGVEGLLAPLVTAGTLKTVKSVGGMDYAAVLKSVIARAPFALIKYVGQVPTGMDGTTDFESEISVLIGAASLKGPDDRRMSIYDILKDTKDVINWVRLDENTTGSYKPLVMTTEQWSAISGGGLEVWEQRYQLGWEEI